MTGNKINGNGNGAGGRGKEMPKIAIVGMAAMFPGEGGTTGFWRTITRGEDTIGEVPSHYWRSEDYYDPDPAAPDKTYCNRGGFIDKVAFDTLKFGVPPSVMKATDTAQLLALMTASEVLDGVEKSQADADRQVAHRRRPRRRLRDRARRPHGQPPPAPDLGQRAPRARHGGGRRQRHLRPHLRSFRPLAGGVLPRPSRQRRRRADRQPARPRRRQFRHRRGLRQLAVGAPGRPVAALSRRSRHGRRRRRRRAQRHPDVHVLLEDAGLLAERRLPAVLRPGRRHHPRRGRGDVRAPPPRGRRARRQRDLRRDHRHRRRVRRTGDQRLRAAARGPGAGHSPRLRGGGLRPGDGRDGRGPRHRHQGRRRRRVRRAPHGLRRRTTRAPPVGARSARSSRRSATPRPPPAAPACSRRRWRSTTA